MRRVSGLWRPHTFSSLLPGLALTHVLEQNLKPAAGPRPEAAKVVILVTDGKSQDDARAAGRTLRSLDVDIFAVGEQPVSAEFSQPAGGSLLPLGWSPLASLSLSPDSAKWADPALLWGCESPRRALSAAGTCREAAVTAEGHEPVCMSVNISRSASPLHQPQLPSPGALLGDPVPGPVESWVPGRPPSHGVTDGQLWQWLHGAFPSSGRGQA